MSAYVYIYIYIMLRATHMCRIMLWATDLRQARRPHPPPIAYKRGAGELSIIFTNMHKLSSSISNMYVGKTNGNEHVISARYVRLAIFRFYNLRIALTMLTAACQ
jgi:hypothetical protein